MLEAGYYKHYKGGVYYLICTALNAHSNNTQDRFVVYKPLDSDIIFCRPASEFEELVELDNGEKLLRFKKIENNVPTITPNIFDPLRPNPLADVYRELGTFITDYTTP
jgi:hypothetical protein